MGLASATWRVKKSMTEVITGCSTNKHSIAKGVNDQGVALTRQETSKKENIPVNHSIGPR